VQFLVEAFSQFSNSQISNHNHIIIGLEKIPITDKFTSISSYFGS